MKLFSIILFTGILLSIGVAVAQEQSPVPPMPSLDQAGMFMIMGQMSVKAEMQARYIQELQFKIIEQAKEIEELKKKLPKKPETNGS